MIEFVYKGALTRLTKAVAAEYPSLSYAHMQKLLRGKDVMVNGKRTKEDLDVKSGDAIRLYTDVRTLDNYEYKVETVYSDKNIIILNKPKGLETEGDISLSAYVSSIEPTAIPCHRLDVNTDGLIIFAKGEAVYDEIVKSLKEGKIEKYYLCAVYGCPAKYEDTVISYLVKDKSKAKVKIYDKPVRGSVKIKTGYKVLNYLGDQSLLEIKLHTGRTHQIRAHMSHLGHPVLGDGKYCPMDINKRFPYQKQALTAYKLVFSTTGKLAYLNGKKFEINCKLKELF